MCKVVSRRGTDCCYKRCFGAESPNERYQEALPRKTRETGTVKSSGVFNPKLTFLLHPTFHHDAFPYNELHSLHGFHILDYLCGTYTCPSLSIQVQEYSFSPKLSPPKTSTSNNTITYRAFINIYDCFKSTIKENLEIREEISF